MTQLKVFEFVTALVLVFKKIESEFEQLPMKLILMMRFNQPILQLYQTCKNLSEKVQTRLLIQSLIILLVFQSIIL